MADAVSFYLSDDFIIKIGKDQKEVIVPRLKYRKSKEVLEKLSEIIGKDSKAILDLVVQSQKANILVNGKSFEGYGSSVQKVIDNLVVDKNYEQIEKLLWIVSDGIITKEIVNTMQYGEVVSILNYLLQENYKALGNLSASLQATIMSGK